MKKPDISKVARTVFVGIIALGMLYPFLWMLSASFTQEDKIFNFPFRLIPDVINLKGYKQVLFRTTLNYPITLYFLNSLKVTVIAVGGTLISCSLAAYAYTKIKFPGRDKIFLLKLATMMIPQQVLMIPNFMIYTKLGLIDTHAALWLLPLLGGAFGTFFLRQYFLSIPMELNEAAEIDGAGHLRIYWNIIMPLSMPVLATLTILQFMAQWNNYESPLIYLRSIKLYTLPLALKIISEDTDVIRYAGVMAGSVFASIPILIIFIVCQKYIINSIMVSGIKG
jgi:ABC-type sugar transport system, permease component